MATSSPVTKLEKPARNSTLAGAPLLHDPVRNKGTAYSRDDRQKLGFRTSQLDGLGDLEADCRQAADQRYAQQQGHIDHAALRKSW